METFQHHIPRGISIKENHFRGNLNLPKKPHGIPSHSYSSDERLHNHLPGTHRMHACMPRD